MNDLHEETGDFLAVWRQTWATISITDTAINLERAIGNSAAMVLLARVEGQAVGSIIGTFDRWRGKIHRRVVHPGHRQQGVASRLLSEVERLLARLGVKRVTASLRGTIPVPWDTGIRQAKRCIPAW